MRNYKLIILSMAFSGLLITFSIAQAQVYSWTDENGNVRFADDLSQVPENIKRLPSPSAHQKSDWKNFDEYGLRGKRKYHMMEEKHGLSLELSEQLKNHRSRLLKKDPT